ncbi:hypothetical protein L6452_00700 [Arctium lappa]|uniref:Uncharacterized protein n=1 Tax=Arctium lappa TaxID=4217 RepID=A0ACB9FFF9_ARCLA|nr:hypothetical protein L6452_00700 [Arctium lappa]
MLMKKTVKKENDTDDSEEDDGNSHQGASCSRVDHQFVRDDAIILTFEGVVELRENLDRSIQDRTPFHQCNVFLLLQCLSICGKFCEQILNSSCSCILFLVKEPISRDWLSSAKKESKLSRGATLLPAADLNNQQLAIVAQTSVQIPDLELETTNISDFHQRDQNSLDPTLLKFAWTELLDEMNKSVTVEELAEGSGDYEELNRRQHQRKKSEEDEQTVIYIAKPHHVGLCL